MKKIIILIHSLGAGGAQKSLVSLLNTLPPDKYNIDLMSVGYLDDFFKAQIPDYVNIISPPKSLTISIISGKSPLFAKYKFGILLAIKYLIVVLKRIYRIFIKGNDEQINWKCASLFIPRFKQKYDVAISYMTGTCNYYVIDKVSAPRKILWVHNDYNKKDYVSSFDLPYFEKANNVITISSECNNSLVENFPTIKDRFLVLENISSKRLISKMALSEIENSTDMPVDAVNLLSIGRYNTQKGFDVAIPAAKILKDRGVKFIWNFLGEGSDREMLQSLIDKNELNDCVKLSGLRTNPYPYIKRCDIFVQPSRYEGKSIVLDEAKILCKPIVVTNYPSVYDSIENGLNGIIVNLDSESIANGIESLIKDEALRDKLTTQLSLEDNSNELEVEKYIKIID